MRGAHETVLEDHGLPTARREAQDGLLRRVVLGRMYGDRLPGGGLSPHITSANLEDPGWGTATAKAKEKAKATAKAMEKVLEKAMEKEREWAWEMVGAIPMGCNPLPMGAREMVGAIPMGCNPLPMGAREMVGAISMGCSPLEMARETMGRRSKATWHTEPSQETTNLTAKLKQEMGAIEVWEPASSVGNLGIGPQIVLGRLPSGITSGQHQMKWITAMRNDRM